METVTKCKWCRKRFRRQKRGRRPLYCCASCRQRAYERRRLEKEFAQLIPMRLLHADIESVQNRDSIRAVVVDVLRELGFLARPAFSSKRKPKLHVVKDDDQNSDQ